MSTKSAKFYDASVTRVVQYQIHDFYKMINSQHFHCLQHIAKERLYGLPNDLMKKGKHFILIRNPIDILVRCLCNLFICHLPHNLQMI